MIETQEGVEPALQVVHVAEIVRGGVGTYLRVLLPLQAERYGAERIALIAPAGDLVGLHLPEGVRAIGFRHRGRRFAGALRAFFVLRRLVRARKAEVVHLHSTFAGFVCRIGLLLYCRRPRVVYCAHGWAFERQSRTDPFYRFVERILSRFTNAIVCISTHDRQSAIDAGIRPHKLVVIHNALPDMADSPPVVEPTWTKYALRLLFVGRFDRQKGLDVLVKALGQVRRPVQLQVFGERIVGERFDVSIPDDVKLHGWADFETIQPYLASCHALVMPSRWEGFGIAALEAMRAGKAVIASNVGGLAEVVDDGATGILVPPGDFNAWASTIETLAAGELASMGKRGRERYKGYFTIERMERSLAELYTNCVRGNKP